MASPGEVDREKINPSDDGTRLKEVARSNTRTPTGGPPLQPWTSVTVVGEESKKGNT